MMKSVRSTNFLKVGRKNCLPWGEALTLISSYEITEFFSPTEAWIHVGRTGNFRTSIILIWIADNWNGLRIRRNIFLWIMPLPPNNTWRSRRERRGKQPSLVFGKKADWLTHWFWNRVPFMVTPDGWVSPVTNLYLPKD